MQGLLRYDIDDNLWLQERYQIKYSDECFVLAASYVETRINNPTLDIKPDRQVMLRFELKHWVNSAIAPTTSTISLPRISRQSRG